MSRVPFANADPNNPNQTGGNNNNSTNNPSSNINYRTLRDYGATTNSAAAAAGSSSHQHAGPAIGSSVAPNAASSLVSIVDHRGGFVGGPNGTVPDITFAGFSPTEFMSLSESIAQNISAVRSSLHMLEQTIRKIGTHSDGPRFRAKL